MIPMLRLIALWAVALASGCGVLRALSPIPDMRTPADRANEVAPKCAGVAGDPVPPSAIDSVEPAYAYLKSGPVDPEARLRGARIHVRPLPGYTKEALARSLECHEARVTLGSAAPSADDPYVLPDRWLDIDVDSERDGFVVQVGTDEIADARQVLERARRFAAQRAAPAAK
jgi:hypothetical protein